MVSPRAELGTLDLLLVADAMTEEVPSVTPGLPLDRLADRAREERSRSWVVVGDDGRMVGMVAVTDLERAIVEGDLEGFAVRDVMTRALVTCAPGETLRSAFRRFTERDVFQIPVVEPDEPNIVLGMLRRTEMMWAYKELSDEHQRLLERTDALQPERRFESTHVEFQVTPGHQGICDHAIREIRVPDHALIALLRRGDRVVVPRGFTRVEPGDILTLITTLQYERELKAWIARLTPGS
jgi:CBS domain-containing protein